MQNLNPILTICVPTFNRGTLLNQLLLNLSKIDRSLIGNIEICISDNGSTDCTKTVVNEWSKHLPIRFHRKEENIGFSGNFAQLVYMATGKWILVIGDDDEIFYERLALTIKKLEMIDISDWIIMPAISVRSQGQSWLTDLKEGRYSPLRFYLLLIAKGISTFGFIGCHIINSRNRDLYLSIPIEQSWGWVHMNYLLFHLYSRRSVTVLCNPLVSVSPKILFSQEYTKMQWAKLWMIRLVNFSRVVSNFGLNRWWLYGIMVREIFAPAQIKEWMSMALIYPRTFRLRLKSILRIFCGHQFSPFSRFMTNIVGILIGLLGRVIGSVIQTRRE
jgi:glycosyltransferase involved in cell wall biosynthesis